MATFKKEFILSGGIGLSADRLFIVSATNSTTISTGSLILSGGAGIAQSLSIGGSLQIFNGSNFTAFKASSASNNIYTLPNQYPAIGTSVLQSNTSGEMSWAPMIASSSSGNTTQNIAINTAGNANIFHPVLLTPSALSAGSAVSSDSTISFNPSTEILYVSGLAVTSVTVSTSSTLGALVVSGGVGIGGSLYVASATGISGVTINNGVVTGNLTGTATTATYAHQAGYAITSGSASIATTALNINLVNGLANSQHRIIFSPTPSGAGVGLSSSAQISYNPSSFILSVSGIAVTSATISNSISTGALIVVGGVGIGGSLYVSSATAISGVTINNGIINGNLTGTATTSRNIDVVAASTNLPHYLLFSPTQNGSGVAVSSGSSITVNPNTNVLSIGTGTFAANGVSIGSSPNTITTASGNLNIDSFGGQTNLNDNVVISGNLTVQGTTLTVDSTISTLVDPVIVIGSGVGGTHSTLDNNQDRGIEFRWSNSGTAVTGFFGFSDTDGKFRFIPQVTSLISSVYSGTAGTAVFTTVEANLSGNSTGTASTYTNFYGTFNGNLVGTSTTSINVHLAAGANSSAHSVIFSPNQTGSGVALSSDSLFTYNPNSDTLVVSNITGIATTASYAYQAGYAITSGSSSIATTATYAHQAGYAITSGSSSTASTATYTHQAGYAVTSGSASIATSAFNISLQNGLNNTSHSVIFSPAASGSGIALSTNQTVTYNPSTSVLSVSGVAVTSSTNSVSSITGAAIVTGGVGIGQSISVGGRLQLFNSSNYTAFVSSATGNTVYTLPATSPAIGSSVLQSNSAGVLSWVPLVASAAAGNTSQNVFVNAAGTADIFHQVLFTPAQQSAGSAVSSDVLLSFNANSDRLFASGISITSGAASTSPFTGALQVTGGLGVSGQATFARASLGFTGVSVTPVMSFIGATTGPIISLSVLNDNSLSFEGSSGQLFAIDNNLSTGEIFSVSDISGLPIISASAGQTVTINEFGGVTRIGDGTYNAVSTTNAGLVVIGGFGVTGNALIGGTTTITSATNSILPSNGALLISGGVGIGQSVSIGGRLQIFNGSNYSAFVSSATGNTVYTLPPTSPAIGSSVLQSNAAGVMSWVPMVAGSSSSGNTSQNVVINAAGNANVFHPVLFTPLQSSSGSAVSSDSTITFNPSSEILNVSGLAVTSQTSSTNTSSGALIVSGGVGVGGTIFAGGLNIQDIFTLGSQIFYPQNTRGFSVNENYNPVGSGASHTGYHFASGVGRSSIYFDLAISNQYTVMFGTYGSSTGNTFVIGSETANSDFEFRSTVGMQPVRLDLGNLLMRINRNGNVLIPASTASTTTTTGALIVTGGVGIGQSLSVGGRLQLFNGSNFTAFVSSATGNTVYTLPATSPATGSSVLQSTSEGVMSWVPMTSGSSSGTVNSGTANFAAYYASTSTAVSENANLQFTGTGLSVGGNINSTSTKSGALYVNGGLGVTGNAFIGGTTTIQSSVASISSSTGALVVSGGAGIGGSLYVGGASRFSDTTQSLSVSSGALVVAGGAGIAQSVSIGGRLQLFNSSNYTAFVSAASGNTVYTLPATSPAIGTSYLVSNAAGVMSWIRPKRSYVLSFGAGFTPSANAADSIQLNIPYAPDNVALNYIVKRVEYRNETVSGGTGLSFYIERHTGGDALWSTAHRIHAGSGASFEVGALVNQISFTTINSSAGTNGLVASGDYIRLYFTTVGSAANVSISLTIEEQ